MINVDLAFFALKASATAGPLQNSAGGCNFGMHHFASDVQSHFNHLGSYQNDATRFFIILTKAAAHLIFFLAPIRLEKPRVKQDDLSVCPGLRLEGLP